MSAVSSVVAPISINLSPAYTPTGLIVNQQIPGTITSNISLVNGNGAALNIDLAAWGQVSLAATTKLIDFSSLVDPGGTTQNWTGGRVRLLAIQVVTTTSGDDIEYYADATNGWSQLPPVANPLYARANGGVTFMFDPNSNGAGVGMVVTSTSKRFNFNSGANTVVFNWVALGSSVA